MPSIVRHSILYAIKENAAKWSCKTSSTVRHMATSGMLYGENVSYTTYIYYLLRILILSGQENI